MKHAFERTKFSTVHMGPSGAKLPAVRSMQFDYSMHETAQENMAATAVCETSVSAQY